MFPDDVDGFHEAFHSLPHVGDLRVSLVLQLRCEGDFLLAEDLAHLLVSGWVLLQLELV